MISITSCKKPINFSGGNLSFSADTIVYDTVFTTVGSTTKILKIYNEDSKTLQIDQIELVGGANSPFRINVDGLSGTNFSGIELEANDSLFIFVEVTIDPNNATNPLIVEDQIRFNTNGTDQFVQLVAWGQDAYFHNRDLNSGTWPNDKPHVVYGYAAINEGQSLTIQANTDIYLHKGAVLWCHKGILNIEGTYGAEVTLQGDRLEASYDDVSGQYFGIYLDSVISSKIDYAIIKNGTSGIHIVGKDPSSPPYTLELTNTIIQNCSSYGLFISKLGSVHAENCIIARNGVQSVLFYGGSAFNFNHCNILGYGIDSSPALGISNYYVDDNTQYLVDISEGTVTNSVIYGLLDYELAMDTVVELGATFTFNFKHNLIRSETEILDMFFDNTNLWNLDPFFKDTQLGDFEFWSMSALKDAGNGFYANDINTAIGVDIKTHTRPPGFLADIGAYEY